MRIDWLVLFFLSFTLRIIGINYGLPYEHNPDEEYTLGFVDNFINSGRVNPGIFNYGYIFFYLVYFTSQLARIFVDAAYIREYEILFTRIAIVIITSITVVVIYEIAQRLYKSRVFGFITALFFSAAISNVTLGRYIYSDPIASFFLTFTILFSIIFVETKKNKWLTAMFIFTGLTVSSKISYFSLLAYAFFIYFLVYGTSDLKNKLRRLIKYVSFFLVTVFIGYSFAFFNLKSWLGTNYFLFKELNSPDYFYFKVVHQNYFEHLAVILNFLFVDFYIVTPYTWILLMILIPIIIFQSIRLFKERRDLFLAASAFPLLFILSHARLQVFQMRHVMGVAFISAVIFFYPFRKFRYNLILITVSALMFVFIFNNTLNAALDVYEKQSEQQIMSIVSSSNQTVGLPYAFYYPSLEYAYYFPPEIKLDLSNYNFFINNKDKIRFYNKDTDLDIFLRKVDLFVLQKQFLGDLEYRKYNELRKEATFETLDVKEGYNIEDALKRNNFILTRQIQTSPYETVLKYDPMSLSQKQFFVYRKKI